MSDIGTAALVMGGLGLFFGTVLAVAYRFLRVHEDPRVAAVETLLPGSNCGACGEPGCHGLAEKVVAGSVPPSKCTVSPKEGIERIAEYLGVDAGAQEKRVARLHCGGGLGRAVRTAEYEGLTTCAAAHLVGGGGLRCMWGCLGLADCEVSCTFDAIRMNAFELPVVDVDLCTACGDCVVACPRDLFEVQPLDHHLLVQCKAPLESDAAREVCRTVCDACGRCAQDAAPGLIRMENGLPVVDYGEGGPARPDATYRCPTGAIRWVEEEQFTEAEGASPVATMAESEEAGT